MNEKAKRIKEKRLNGFLQTPKKLIQLVTYGYLSSGAYALYSLILSLAVFSHNSPYYGTVELNASQLAKLYSKSRSSVYRYFNELRDAGLVKRIDSELTEVTNFNEIVGKGISEKDGVSNMEQAVSNLIQRVAERSIKMPKEK